MKIKHNLVKFVMATMLFTTGLATVTSTTNNTNETVQAATTSEKRSAVAKLAKKQVGKAYVYGATGPSAFDCSGLAQYVYKNAINKTLPRTTYAQINKGKSVSLKNLKKGDLLFWGSTAAPYHVGIYVGNGKYVHAATPGQGVIKQTISAYFYPSAAKRILD